MKHPNLIYLEPPWRLHSAYQILIRYPPDGYMFVTDAGAVPASLRWVSQFAATYSLLAALNLVMPVYLFKSYLDTLKRPRPDTGLTYAVNHLVLRDEPWILDLSGEHVTGLLGGIRHFERLKGTVERVLASDNCRAIVVDRDVTRKALDAALDVDLARKVRVVDWAVPMRHFTKAFNDSKVKLLFVGSANIPGQFHYKGGKEALEAFLLLRQRYHHLEMVLRCDLPRAFRRRLRNVEGLRIMDRIVPWQELELEFMTADIFVFPAHIPSLWVVLDAMSYALPVVTTDAWGNDEIVEDGVTGLIVHDAGVAASRQNMLARYFAPPEGSPEYEDAIRPTNNQMVRELVDKLSLLIDDGELRRNLGRTGREMVEGGKFSIRNRNKTLKAVLDEAT